MDNPSAPTDKRWQEGVAMKQLSVWLVVLVTMMFAVRYTYQIWKREISPMLSTWIISFSEPG